MKTIPWDPAAYIDDPESAAAYLEAALEAAVADADHRLITAALGDIARARGMSGIAREAGVTREALYKALSAEGDPKLSTLMGVLKALGLRLTAVPGGPA